MKPHQRFRDFAETLDYLEACRVLISPDGSYSVPAEKDGRISLVSPTTRKALGKFLRGFADRLECPDPKHVERTRRRS